MIAELAAPLGAGLGSFLGGTLGQLGEALGAPRRALWSLLGAPASGADLVAGLTGQEASSPLTQALGLGAEILGDPLTYLGLGFGRAAGSALGADARLASQAAKAQSARALAEKEGAEAAALLGRPVAPAGLFSQAETRVPDELLREFPEALGAPKARGVGRSKSELQDYVERSQNPGGTIAQRPPRGETKGLRAGRVSPEAAAALEETGLGMPMGPARVGKGVAPDELQVLMNTNRIPSFLQTGPPKVTLPGAVPPALVDLAGNPAAAPSVAEIGQLLRGEALTPWAAEAAKARAAAAAQQVGHLDDLLAGTAFQQAQRRLSPLELALVSGGLGGGLGTGLAQLPPQYRPF